MIIKLLVLVGVLILNLLKHQTAGAGLLPVARSLASYWLSLILQLQLFSFGDALTGDAIAFAYAFRFIRRFEYFNMVCIRTKMSDVYMHPIQKKVRISCNSEWREYQVNYGEIHVYNTYVHVVVVYFRTDR